MLERRSVAPRRPPTDGTWRSVGPVGLPAMDTMFGRAAAGNTWDEWTEISADTDACFTPVLTWSASAHSEHLRAPETMVTGHGGDPAAPAPRFSRTPLDHVGAAT